MRTCVNNYGKYNTEEMTELAEHDAFVEAQKSMLKELIDTRVDLMTKHYDDAFRRVTRLVNELSADIKISTKKRTIFKRPNRKIVQLNTYKCTLHLY